MKLEKEMKKEMKRLGLKDEKDLLRLLRNLDEMEVLMSNNSKVGLIIVGNESVLPEKGMEILKNSDKIASIIKPEISISSYLLDEKTFKELEEKLKTYNKKH